MSCPQQGLVLVPANANTKHNINLVILREQSIINKAQLIIQCLGMLKLSKWVHKSRLKTNNWEVSSSFCRLQVTLLVAKVCHPPCLTSKTVGGSLIGSILVQCPPDLHVFYGFCKAQKGTKNNCQNMNGRQNKLNKN